MADKDYSYRTIGTGKQSVTTAGTAVQLSSTSVPCRMVEIQSVAENTDTIVIGDANVVATAGSRQGIGLEPNQSVALRVTDLNKLYIDAVVSGEKVTYVYFND